VLIKQNNVNIVGHGTNNILTRLTFILNYLGKSALPANQTVHEIHFFPPERKIGSREGKLATHVVDVFLLGN